MGDRSPLLFRHSSPLTLMALGVAIYFLYLYIWIFPRGSSGGFPAARPVVPLLHSTKKQKMKTFFLNSPSLSTTVSSTNYFPALPAPGSVWVSPRVCPIENARWGVNRLVLSLSVGANKAGIPHTDRVDSCSSGAASEEFLQQLCGPNNFLRKNIICRRKQIFLKEQRGQA